MSDRRNRAIYEAITGGRSPRTEPQGWAQSLDTLRGAFGGNVSALARALDVPRRTMRRWISGESQPPADRRQLVTRAAARITRRARLKDRRETRLRGATSIRVQGIDRYDDSERDVTFRVEDAATSTKIDADAFGAIIDAYLTGGSADDGGRATQNEGIFNEVTQRLHGFGLWYRDFFSSTAPDWGIDVYEVTIK